MARVANLQRYLDWLAQRGVLRASGYAELWRWSTTELEAFWQSIWDFYGVKAFAPPREVLAEARMPGAKWFPGAQVNYAARIFADRDPQATAVIAVDEAGTPEPWTWARLERETAALAARLRSLGVRPGDRVVAYLNNTPEALVGLLASASIGAVWAACAQDVGLDGVLSRLGQLNPVVLLTSNQCRYNGVLHDRREIVAALQARIPSLRGTIVVDRDGATAGAGQIAWSVATAAGATLAFEPVAFDHPLWVLFSSGTTGKPKGIVHGHGGVLLEHLKYHGLHLDLGADDVFFWPCTTSWVMWNILASALLHGSTIVLYSGSPLAPTPARIWEIAAAHRVTVLGSSPALLQACEKDGVRPSRFDLAALRRIGCTGSPIPSTAYAWIERELGNGVPLTSLSGGTDVAAAFVSGCPLLPEVPGENSAPCLGVALQAWDPAGTALVDEVGEMVVTKPMPSMPLAFWDDPDGKRLRDAYFDVYPGVWRHGDWITVTRRGSVIVHGRSDATLNRRGVRLGSAEIYDVVEKLPEVREALVVGIELPQGNYWMPLFVHLRDGAVLDDALRARINAAIRQSASPHHVPDAIHAVPGIPHSMTGKRLEVPIKRILQGTPVEKAVSLAAVDQPQLIAHFQRFRPPD